MDVQESGLGRDVRLFSIIIPCGLPGLALQYADLPFSSLKVTTEIKAMRPLLDLTAVCYC